MPFFNDLFLKLQIVILFNIGLVGEMKAIVHGCYVLLVLHKNDKGVVFFYLSSPIGGKKFSVTGDHCNNGISREM